MVLSYSSWEGRFGKEPSVIGRELTLNGHVFMVIGVGPEGFQGTEIAPAPEFFVPTMMFEQVTPRPDWIFERRALMFDVIGRLKPGVTIGTAQAEMKTIARNLEAEYPEPNGGRSVMLAPLSRIDPGASAQIGLAMALLTGIAGLVLAIAAANVANLLMVRAAARKREIAVRGVARRRPHEAGTAVVDREHDAGRSGRGPRNRHCRLDPRTPLVTDSSESFYHCARYQR